MSFVVFEFWIRLPLSAVVFLRHPLLCRLAQLLWISFSNRLRETSGFTFACNFLLSLLFGSSPWLNQLFSRIFDDRLFIHSLFKVTMFGWQESKLFISLALIVPLEFDSWTFPWLIFHLLLKQLTASNMVSSTRRRFNHPFCDFNFPLSRGRHLITQCVVNLIPKGSYVPHLPFTKSYFYRI